MKKFFMILILIGIGVSLYFFFKKPDKTDIAHKSLMPDTASNETAPDNTNDEIDNKPLEEIQSSNAIKNNNKEDIKTVPENSITFAVVLKGEYNNYSYKAMNNFTKITASPQLTGYTASFVANINNINLSDQSTYNNVVSMMLPLDAGPGAYNEKSDNFIFQYIGANKGILYTLDQSGSFDLTIMEWGGPGGRAKGTFSGKLLSVESTDPVYIQDGKFDIGIQ